MISLDVKVLDEELLVKLDRLPAKLHEMIRLKMDEEMTRVRMKVVENLSGKVLNSKSGAILSSLVSGVEEVGSLMVGFVAVESSDAKVTAYAAAHEYGGKGFYEIVPVHKRVLRFISKGGDVVFAPYVFHPPMPERSYLRSALHEMAPAVEEGLSEAIRAAMQ